MIRIRLRLSTGETYRNLYSNYEIDEIDYLLETETSIDFFSKKGNTYAPFTCYTTDVEEVSLDGSQGVSKVFISPMDDGMQCIEHENAYFHARDCEGKKEKLIPVRKYAEAHFKTMLEPYMMDAKKKSSLLQDMLSTSIGYAEAKKDIGSMDADFVFRYGVAVVLMMDAFVLEYLDDDELPPSNENVFVAEFCRYVRQEMAQYAIQEIPHL